MCECHPIIQTHLYYHFGYGKMSATPCCNAHALSHKNSCSNTAAPCAPHFLCECISNSKCCRASSWHYPWVNMSMEITGRPMISYLFLQ